MRRFGQILRKTVIGVLVLGMLAGASWGVWHWSMRSGDAVQFRTEKVQRGRVAAVINASGTVVPEEVVDVGAQVAGKIDAFGKDLDFSNKAIDYGSRVEKGTQLAVIDKSLYAAAKASAVADVATAEADLERARADVKKAVADLEAAKAKAVQATKDYERGRRAGGSVTPLELDALQAANATARAGVPSAEAALERAKKTVLRSEAAKQRAEAALEGAATNLAYCDIVSPIAGVIIDRRVNIGQTVVSNLNAPSLFLIAKDLRRMQVWASVNEADIGRITEGQTVYFRVDAYPTDVFTGTVSQVRMNALNTQNVVTYTVVVEADNPTDAKHPNGKLLPYLTANLQFQIEHHDDVLTVPNSALRYRPAPERVGAKYRDKYARSRKERKPASSEIRPGSAGVAPKGTVWVQGPGGDLAPVRVKLGLNDGAVTEILEVIQDQGGPALDADSAVVTGEQQAEADTGKNPFAVNMAGAKKKE